MLVMCGLLINSSMESTTRLMVDTCGLHQFFQTLYDNNRIFDNFITYGPMEFNVYERNSQFVNVEA